MIKERRKKQNKTLKMVFKKLIISSIFSYCSCSQPKKSDRIITNTAKDSIQADSVIKNGLLKLVDEKDK